MSQNNNYPKLIGIHGKKRTGKGVVAQHLKDHYNYEIVKFASPLKDMVAFFMKKAGFSEDVIFLAIESDYKEIPIDAFYNKSSRYIMQSLGLEWRDSINQDMFTIMSENLIQTLLAQDKNVAIDDLRFSHEYNFLKNINAELWCVTRDITKISSKIEVPNILIAPNKNVFTHENFKEIIEYLLVKYCDLDENLAKVIVSDKDSNFSNKVFSKVSPYKAVENLHNIWLPIMKKPLVLNEEIINSHNSEQGLPLNYFEQIFENNTNLDDFKNKIDQFFNNCVTKLKL